MRCLSVCSYALTHRLHDQQRSFSSSQQSVIEGQPMQASSQLGSVMQLQLTIIGYKKNL